MQLLNEEFKKRAINRLEEMPVGQIYVNEHDGGQTSTPDQMITMITQRQAANSYQVSWRVGQPDSANYLSLAEVEKQSGLPIGKFVAKSELDTHNAFSNISKETVMILNELSACWALEKNLEKDISVFKHAEEIARGYEINSSQLGRLPEIQDNLENVLKKTKTALAKLSSKAENAIRQDLSREKVLEEKTEVAHHNM